MFRSMSEKPVKPKNGDRYKDTDGITKIFRNGTWLVAKPIKGIFSKE